MVQLRLPRLFIIGLVGTFILCGFSVLATAQIQVETATAPSTENASKDSSEKAARAAILQQIASDASNTDAEQGAIDSNTSTPKSDDEPKTPEVGITFSPETEVEFQRAWQAYYAYRINGYAHRQKVFEWQDLSTKIIFIVVILLVIAGIYFAGVQFHVGMREGRNGGESGEVELTFRGIKVRSPVLGVIVLTISLAFFYLYLVYVYPIENVF